MFTTRICFCVVVLFLVWNVSALALRNGNAQYKPNLRVSLAFYSGLPPPEWTLTSNSSSYDDIVGELARHTKDSLPAVLGYKGFVVSVEAPHAGVPTIYQVRACSDPTLENQLLATSADNVPDKVKDMVHSAISHNCK